MQKYVFVLLMIVIVIIPKNSKADGIPLADGKYFYQRVPRESKGEATERLWEIKAAQSDNSETHLTLTAQLVGTTEKSDPVRAELFTIEFSTRQEFVDFENSISKVESLLFEVKINQNTVSIDSQSIKTHSLLDNPILINNDSEWVMLPERVRPAGAKVSTDLHLENLKFFEITSRRLDFMAPGVDTKANIMILEEKGQPTTGGMFEASFAVYFGRLQGTSLDVFSVLPGSLVTARTAWDQGMLGGLRIGVQSRFALSPDYGVDGNRLLTTDSYGDIKSWGLKAIEPRIRIIYDQEVKKLLGKDWSERGESTVTKSEMIHNPITRLVCNSGLNKAKDGLNSRK